MQFSQGSQHLRLHRLCAHRYWQTSLQGGHDDAQLTLQLRPKNDIYSKNQFGMTDEV